MELQNPDFIWPVEGMDSQRVVDFRISGDGFTLTAVTSPGALGPFVA